MSIKSWRVLQVNVTEKIPSLCGIVDLTGTILKIEIVLRYTQCPHLLYASFQLCTKGDIAAKEEPSESFINSESLN
jgi:hypothetical protein